MTHCTHTKYDIDDDPCPLCELEALRKQVDELEEWRRQAFQAHPNIDLDIEALLKQGGE